MNPQPKFCVISKLCLHSDMYIWAPFSWIQRTLRLSKSRGHLNLRKEQGYLDLVSDYGAQRARFNA